MMWRAPLVRGMAAALLSVPPAIAGAGAQPLIFESNLGQTDARVRFLARGEGFTLFLTPEEIVASGPGGPVRMKLRGAAAKPVIKGLEPLPGKSNYIRGGGRSVTGVPQFARVRYRKVYPGIDLVFYGDRRGIEFDLEVAPGADPGRIGIEIEGAEPVIEGDGSVVAGALRLAQPVALQGGKRIPAEFARDDGGGISFRLGAYDRARALRIDPVLSYSTYLGGDTAASGGNDYIRGTATDAYGNVYVVGATQSTSFPSFGVQAPVFNNTGNIWNAFFAKFTPDGAPVYCTYFQGDSLHSEASALAVDAAGNLYVTGFAYNGNFPATPGAYQSQRVNAREAFVLKLNPEGKLAYATLLGGEGDDYGTAIVVDDAGQATIAGSTASTQFPITEGAVQTTKSGFSVPFVSRFNADGTKLLFSTYLGGQGDTIQALAFDVNRELLVAGQAATDLVPATADALRPQRQYQDGFLLRLSDNGSTILYCTYIGGASTDDVRAMNVDPAGNIWLAGSTYSWDLPVSENADQKRPAGASDAFLTKLDPSGREIQHFTYFGGKDADAATKIAFDQAGFIYLAGETSSADLPVAETAVQPVYGGGATDAFLAIFDPDVKRVSSTYLGGKGEERVTGIAFDPGGDVWVAGNTLSADFLTTDSAFRRVLSPGGFDGFLARLGSLATSRTYATFLGGGGGSRGEQALDVAVDPSGSAYVVGTSYSTNFPATLGSYLPAPVGSADAFVTKFDPSGKTILFSTYIGGTADDTGAGIALGPDGSIWLAGTTNSRDFPVTEGAPQAKLAGGLDTWFAKLSGDGSQLLFATYFGGTGTEQYVAIAAHPSGGVFVVGSTSSGDLAATPGSFQTPPAWTDVFALRLTAEGQVDWVARAGGVGAETVSSAAVDSAGRLLVGGYTTSQDLPVTPGSFQTVRSGGDEGFAMQFEADGKSLVFASYLGGGNDDRIRRVALDPSGNILIAGYTNSSNFPTTAGVIRTALAGSFDGFLVKLNPNGSKVVWSTLLGSTSTDYIYAMAVDAQSNVVVAGSTYSGGFPVSPTTSVQNLNRGNGEGFISRIVPDATAMSYSSFLGGSGTDFINAVALDSKGNPIAVGQTCSVDFPVTEVALQPAIGGPCNAFVVKTDFSVPTPVRNPPSIRSVEHYVLNSTDLNPGMIFRIKGSNLAKDTVTAAAPGQQASGALPTSLGGATVTFTPNLPVPLFSVSPTEIVGQVPYNVPNLTVMTVSTADGIASRQLTISYAPQWGLIGVYKSDMSAITTQNRISPGDTMVIHVVGGVMGQGASFPKEGVPVPSAPAYDQFVPLPAVIVRSYPAPAGGGMNCDLVSIKLLPGYIGVAEVRVKMPAGTGNTAGEADVYMFVGSGTSNMVRIYQPPIT